MKIRMFVLSVLMLPTLTRAAEYTVIFDHHAAPDVVAAAEARVRELSTQTASGRVRIDPVGNAAIADLSDQAAGELTRVAGVSEVRSRPKIHPLAPSARTQDNLDRTIILRDDLTENEFEQLHEAIRGLAEETGTGHFRASAPNILTASLSHRAVRVVSAMQGVVAIEDSRSPSTQRRGCQSDFK